MKDKMMTCAACGQEIAKNAKACPHCGAKNKKPIYKRWWFIVLVILVLLVAIGGSGSDTDSETGGNQIDGSVEQDATADNEKADDNIPSEYKSALNKAKSYSDIMHMSKAAIYDQLVSEYGEQFTEEAAQYAMENLQADYKANALAKAEDYSDTMNMSKAGIYDQLISEYGEQFTEEEAQYAVDNMEADWNANALAKAESYRDTMDMSPAAIYDQLISEYGEQFTAEQAQYAIDNLD